MEQTGFTALERAPRAELEARWARCRRLMAEHFPGASGLLAFSRVNLYWLTGALANGLCWLPAEGEPVLLSRKGIERARLESPVAHILPFRSYSNLAGLLAEAGSPLGEDVAVECSGLSWMLGQKLEQALSPRRLLPGDRILALGRMVKTPWELAKLRLCGERHHRCLHDLLPARIRPGMTEREISHACWEVFFSQGHSGQLRMGAFGEEIFLGHVSAGDSGNYPSVFDGPLGLRGEHPALPFMGYAGRVWKAGEPLACDVGFCLEGYQTDKTQVYFAGRESEAPPDLDRAHRAAVAIQARVAELAVPGALPRDLWLAARAMAEKEGVAEGFMGLGGNKVAFVGHGIGLHIDEFPPLADKVETPLEPGMALAIEPKIGVPGRGMVGVENTFEVRAEGGAACLTGDAYGMVCVAG
ncbi:MAG: Xaa-Pro peptidase family protein [Thermodesulfobacteriota bacterium]